MGENKGKKEVIREKNLQNQRNEIVVDRYCCLRGLVKKNYKDDSEKRNHLFIMGERGYGI